MNIDEKTKGQFKDKYSESVRNAFNQTHTDRRTNENDVKIRILFRGSLTERRGFGGEWNKFLFVKKEKKRTLFRESHAYMTRDKSD